MKITKKELDEIQRHHCAASIHMKHENHIIYVSEDPDVMCEMFSGKSFEHKEAIWRRAGGCVSIILIPNREGEFLAVQELHPKVPSSPFKIAWGKYTGGGFVIKDILQLPYIHRSDIYHRNEASYFIGATIVTTKQNKEDWSVPERIYVGESPGDLNEDIQIEVLMDGLYHNHDYHRGTQYTCGCFGGDQGIVKVVSPIHRGGQWQVEYVLNGTTGEIAVSNIGGDGEQGIMTIEPFHGTEIHIYRKLERSYQQVYTYKNGIGFAHTLVGGTLRGVPTFLAGVRRRDAEPFYVQYRDGASVTRGTDRDVGSANLCLVSEKDRDLIAATNRMANEAAVYVVEDQEVCDAGRTEKEGAGGKSTAS